MQIDDWACELSDGGTLERPGRPDGGVADSGFDASTDVGALLDSGVLDSGTDVGALDAGDTEDGGAGLVDIGLTCRLPVRTAAGHPEVIEATFSVENLGDADSGPVTLRLELFNELTSTWSEVVESTVAARVRPEEVRPGSVDLLLPNFIVAGVNRYRCTAVADADVDGSNDVTEGELLVDVREDLALTGFGVPAGELGPDTLFTFSVRNAGPVAVRGAWLEIGAGNEFGGGAMTYGGSHLEGQIGARMEALVAGGTRTEGTRGWCFYGDDSYELTGAVGPLNRTTEDATPENNSIVAPGLRAYWPGDACNPVE